MGVLNAPAKGQDPAKEFDELFSTKPAPATVTDFPRNIPKVFCDPSNVKLQNHWKGIQSQLEAKLRRSDLGKPEAGAPNFGGCQFR